MAGATGLALLGLGSFGIENSAEQIIEPGSEDAYKYAQELLRDKELRELDFVLDFSVTNPERSGLLALDSYWNAGGEFKHSAPIVIQQQDVSGLPVKLGLTTMNMPIPKSSWVYNFRASAYVLPEGGLENSQIESLRISDLTSDKSASFTWSPNSNTDGFQAEREVYIEPVDGDYNSFVFRLESQTGDIPSEVPSLPSTLLSPRTPETTKNMVDLARSQWLQLIGQDINEGGSRIELIQNFANLGVVLFQEVPTF